MTEDTWFVCASPKLMLARVLVRGTDRKARLFGVACCRRVWHLLTDPRSRAAVDKAELFAEGMTTRRALRDANDLAALATPDIESKGIRDAAIAATKVAESEVSACTSGVSYAVANAVAEKGSPCNFVDSIHAENLAHVSLIHCIVGNPFRPVTLNPTWLQWNANTVRKMAQAIHDDRDFELLPILADALEEAGCDNREVLDHCRSDGEHVRGCWVVDLLTGNV
jgi:hypothetical protein